MRVSNSHSHGRDAVPILLAISLTQLLVPDDKAVPYSCKGNVMQGQLYDAGATIYCVGITHSLFQHTVLEVCTASLCSESCAALHTAICFRAEEKVHAIASERINMTTPRNQSVTPKKLLIIIRVSMR